MSLPFRAVGPLVGPDSPHRGGQLAHEAIVPRARRDEKRVKVVLAASRLVGAGRSQLSARCRGRGDSVARRQAAAATPPGLAASAWRVPALRIDRYDRHYAGVASVVRVDATGLYIDEGAWKLGLRPGGRLGPSMARVPPGAPRGTTSTAPRRRGTGFVLVRSSRFGEFDSHAPATTSAEVFSSSRDADGPARE